MSDKIPVDNDAVNKRLNSATERDRIKREEEERRQSEEDARLAEEREEILTLQAAQLRDQFFTTFEMVDMTDEDSVQLALTQFKQCQQILSGEKPLSTPAPASPMAAPTDPSVPFDWDSRSENQKKVIKLVADNELTDKKAAVLETVLTAPANRFYIRPSGALGDGQAKDLDKTYKDAQAAASSTEPAPATQRTPTPAPSPANMPAKKAPVKTTEAPPAQPSESALPSETTQPSGESTDETSSEPKKQTIKERVKGAAGTAKETTRKVFNALD